ncbi:MAG: Na/Pi cotransporter family protein [Oscillospiraceae bacterium]|nr:Na/Pi cotransporter family protein [Oscillospiraceae bacterium]
MELSQALTLFGGLALFLYSMNMMSAGLEAAAGNKMKSILEKLTSSTFMGVIVGTVITAIIQSSSATTVMLVGFVNSGLMQLSQAVGVIMGANIGTTVTGLLITLDIKEIAPVFAFIGVCFIVFSKKEKLNHWGKIIAGFGILFIGMDMMSGSMSGLRDSEVFVNVITEFSNPFIGILAGTIFTAIIQSSSASVGILQALAMSGVVTLDNGIYVLFGFTIGTCVTAVLASLGTSVNAKRTTLIHLLFNIIGTAIFLVICELVPFTTWFANLFPNNPSAQIANAHLVYKVVTTIILFPFAKQLVKLSTIILPEKESEKARPSLAERCSHMSTYNVGNMAIIITSIREELEYMYSIAKENVALSFDAVLKNTMEYEEILKENEDKLDTLNAQICQYLSTIISKPMPAQDSELISGYFRIVGNIERIGDHARNFSGYIKYLTAHNMSFSERALGEIEKMKTICLEAMKAFDNDMRSFNIEALTEIAQVEQRLDDLTDAYRKAQIERMKTTSCAPEASVFYSEMLTDVERIGDHLLNIAEQFAQMYSNK